MPTKESTCRHLALLLVLALAGTSVFGQVAPQLRTVHNQNNVQMTLSNNGGIGWATWYWSDVTVDPFSGEKFATVHYPRNSNIRYQMDGDMLLGAIVNGDTISSSSSGMASPEGELGRFRYRSIDYAHPNYHEDAHSSLDITCEYTDTFSFYNSNDPSAPKPLEVNVIQTSMAWTGDNIDDFIIFNYEIQNRGKNHLEDVYIGFRAHGGVNYVGTFDNTLIWLDDVVGFIGDYPVGRGCDFSDFVGVAYQMDLDGDPQGTSSWTDYSPRAAVGFRVLGLPSDHWRVNFNWSAALGQRGPWFSPQRMPSPGTNYRANLPHIPQIYSDGDIYYMLANPEVDYDQMYVAIDQTDNGWQPLPSSATSFAERARPYYLVSAGPFDLRPGEVKNAAMAVVGGEKVHVNPWDFAQAYKSYDPGRYYDRLDFSRLVTNARWAGWIYDNPGVDTDGDGYAGNFAVCRSDTVYLSGDGVPDLRADGPPQSPLMRVIPSEGQLTIRWNGYLTETFVDRFTNIADFEGYRVYAGLDGRRSSLSLLVAYDKENYDRFRLEIIDDEIFRWVNEEIPFTLDSLRNLYGNIQFRPENYTQFNPLHIGDTLYYFSPHSYNASSLCCSGEIHKAFPNARNPGDDPTQWTEEDLLYDYGDPVPKFYEYEYIYDSLLSTIPYYVAVSAFDFGFAGGGIPSKESDPQTHMIQEMPQEPVDTVSKYDLDVFVYPNPWRWDAKYSKYGYENRDGTQITARSHRINFSNLPKVCSISIYSLDGDLVRKIEHNYPEGGPSSMHDSWDMITRNTQAVVSGLYYWVVESAEKTQMGTFTIIM